MKKQIVLIGFLFLCVSSVNIMAENGVDRNMLTDDAVSNYLTDIQSGNEGVRISSAFLAGEYRIDDAVIPLMKILNSDNNEEARIVAALSLAKIGSGKAVYAIKQAAVLDKSERVRNMCARFYSALVMHQQIDFSSDEN